MSSKKIKDFTDAQKEVLRTIGSIVQHEYSGKSASERDVEHLKYNAIRSLILLGFVEEWQYEGVHYYDLTAKGWEQRRALSYEHGPDVCVRDGFVMGDITFVVSHIHPNGVVVAEVVKSETGPKCPHCGQVMA